ncbi:hypothetical protein A5695_10695 [Mycobacterium sp. E1747]|nr:hypothetical protein A5695_10695 [Mycobacterium sp. E1747]
MAAITRAERICSPLGVRSNVVTPLPASAGAPTENASDSPLGGVSVTVEPPHWRHPASTAASWARAAAGSWKATTASMTWVDFRKLRESRNSVARYPAMPPPA